MKVIIRSNASCFRPRCFVERGINLRSTPMFSRIHSRTSVIACRCVTSVATGKHKVPQKRASSLLMTLRNEAFVNLKNGRNFPQVQSGDSIAITRKAYISSTDTETLKGVVISVTNRASDTAVTIINVEHGTPLVRRIVLYNPLVQNVTILQKAFIHGGKKRVRRSKLYYLLDRDPDTYTVN